MRKIYLLPMVFFGTLSFGQVGINNNNPKSTLDVTSKTTDGSVSEGFILPRVTGNSLKAAETAGVYGEDQNATLLFVTVAPDPVNRTGQVEGMDLPGFYYFDAGSNRWIKMISSGTSTAAVTQLLCSASTTIGTLEAGTHASGVSVMVPYNGGNGGVYSGLNIPSIDVTNLNAVLVSGTLNNGSGILVFNIIGTPSSAGSATFNIDLGGESCSFSIPVQPSSNFIDVVDVTVNGQVRQMMTRNLGADPTQDPSIPLQAILGNYYQWGRKNPAATAYTGSSSISGWNATAAANKSWNSGTEAVPVKTANDPCPAGFRVPTRDEWTGFNNASTKSNIGTFLSSPGSATNFSVAKKFINNGSTLTFPIAGTRANDNGSLSNRGYNGVYWSSTEASAVAGKPTGYDMTITSNALNPSVTNYRQFGFSIRCISE
ncbi:hypothetical protein OWR28_14520 [Chryseobacterium sp. 1B4]